MIPRRPIDISSTIRFGSMRVSRICFQNDISTSSIVAPAVWSSMPFGWVVIPSMSLEERREIGCQDVDDVLPERALGPEVRRFPDRLLCPVPVSAMRLGQLSDICSRVVHDLLPEILGNLLPARGDRRRRADVRRWRHRGHVGGHGEEDPGRSSPGPWRIHVEDDRDFRGEFLLDDRSHRGVEATGGVREDDDGVVALVVRPVDRARQVVLRDRVDVVCELDCQNPRAVRCRGVARRCHGGTDQGREERKSLQESALQGVSILSVGPSSPCEARRSLLS